MTSEINMKKENNGKRVALMDEETRKKEKGS